MRVRRRSDALLRRALDGRVPPDADVAAVERLDRLARVHAQSRPRAALVTIVAGALLALITLASMPVRTTDVTLDVRTSAVAFTVDERQPLLSPHAPLLLTSLFALGLSEVRVPETEAVLRGERGGLGLSLVAAAPSTRQLLTLESPIVEPGQRLHLEVLPEGTGYVMEVQCPGSDSQQDLECSELDLRVSFLGRVDYEVLESQTKGHVDPGFPEAFRLRTDGRDTARMEVETLSDTVPVLAWQVRVRDLSFDEVEELDLPDGRPVVRYVWGLSSGELRFVNLPESRLRIHRGNPLRLVGAEGILQAVELGHGVLRVTFSGTVDDVTLGRKPPRSWYSKWLGERGSLMPSWLDVGASRPGYRLAAGLLASVLLIALGLGNLTGMQT